MHAGDDRTWCLACEHRLIVHPAFEYGGVRHDIHDPCWTRDVAAGFRIRVNGGDLRGGIEFCRDRTLALPVCLAYRVAMGDLDRLVPSGIIEQWVYHLRRQRARASDAIWLIDQGFTLHDGQGGTPRHDATARWREEQETVVAEVTALLALYDGINLGTIDAE